MRSIVSLSLLTISVFNTSVSLIQKQSVESLLTTDITGSEYSILFAQEADQFDNLVIDTSTIASSLETANSNEKNRYAEELEKQAAAEKEAEEQAQREAEAREREAERQRILAQEREKAEQQRREAEAAAAREREAAAATPPPSSNISGSKQDWMSAAGIPQDQWAYVDFIVQKESSWNPSAVNRSSGACGLAQALPCSKIAGDWSDPVVALKWQYNYVNNRYGGYIGAYDFWRANNWY